MKYHHMRNRLAVVFVAVLLFPAVGAGSEKLFNEQPWEKFGLSAGYFLSTEDTSLRLGGGLAFDIDLEDFLGLDTSSSVYRFEGLWRFTDNRRHRLNLSWFSLNRESTLQISDDLTFENEAGEEITIDAGATVASYFNLDIYQLSYNYSFFQDERLDLSAGIGMYVMPIDAGLSAVEVFHKRGRAKFTAPLPVLGLRMDVALTPRWYIRTGTQIFYVAYGDFKGSLLNVGGAVEYKPWTHVGIGLGYDSMKIAIESEAKDWPEIDLRGKVQFNYTGLQHYMRLFF